MNRLKLDLNDLRVESFETTLEEVAAEGLVVGQTTTSPDTQTPPNLCGGTSSYCHTLLSTCCHLCTD
jgi:hypothetical protein